MAKQKTYHLHISEKVSHSAEIVASSEKEAREKFRALVDDGNFDWSNGEYVEFEVENVEEIE
jgi:hypothetical protein